MASLIPASEVARDPNGRALLAGMFGVDHEIDRDRLVVDRRPHNYYERRLQWSRLPQGAQLARLVLLRGQGVRGSGNDLRTYFYTLRNAPQARPRNAFGRPFTGEEAAALGGDPSVVYYLTLEVVAMGDTNAVDVANEVHRELLLAGGCLAAGTELVYGSVMSDSLVLEGVYIDDHFIVGIVPQRLMDTSDGPDRDLADSASSAYARAGIPQAPEKGYGFCEETKEPAERRGARDFTVLGSQVVSDPGLVGSPIKKRAELLAVAANVIQVPYVSRDILTRGLALFVHPFQHRKCLMACFGEAYRFAASIPEKKAVRWDSAVRGELAAGLVMFPIALAHIRWPVSERLVTTDATLEVGAATAAYASRGLAQQLYRYTEQRGCHVRLDGIEHGEDNLLPPFY